MYLLSDMLFLESLDGNRGLILTDYGKGMVIIMKKWKKSLENRKIGLTIFAAAIRFSDNFPILSGFVKALLLQFCLT